MSVPLLPSRYEMCILYNIGSANAYKHEKEVQAIIRCLMSLPLLPAEGIPQGLADIKTILSEDFL